ncbi:AbfB domain-containing protein [Cystobacter ferrugineus]|uniref:Alpha-L-arabinofuranosidase B arabinose-binding domain-containing protein n=1 Tax=Cystobacter ferrugineus TaxID=83449 RepID=A0A1L9BIU0_9BACT|nr:AbfB domain-containing protein [Cystobacter ferrugineus]OJH42212.1 hypothetical protein BON30_03085 [Cystobacter ferrugineus]
MRGAKLRLTTLLASTVMVGCGGARDTDNADPASNNTDQAAAVSASATPVNTVLSWVPLRMNVYYTLGVTTPNHTNRVLRHYESLARTDVIGTSATEKADSSFRVVAGLADKDCYSLESQNYPGRYLRHSNSPR